jgi:Zn-dependent metalloprotease
MRRILQIALLLVLILGSVSPAAPSFAQGGPTPPAPAAAPASGMAPAANPTASSLAPGGAPLVAYHAVTGKARFVSAAPGQALSTAPGFTAGVDTPERAARVFLDQYAAEFGLRDPASELQVSRTHALEPGLNAVRFQQVYHGVPVFGGDLTVHVDDSGAARVAIGEMAPELNISTQPQIDASQAAAAAIEYVAKQYGYDPAGLRAAAPALWIYNPALLDYRGMNANRLVWRTEITAAARADRRELALVDAVTGGMALNFNQVDGALVRRIYDNNNNPALGLPGGSPVRIEGDAPIANTDADNAYDYGGATYNFYHNVHGRDSYDNAGATLVQTVRYCPDAIDCPLANAFWNGTQMVYGENYASGDDIVAHELTHAVTEHESGLFYWMQSGAINEALSDIWGEIVDLGYTNGQDNDTAGVRWQIGEDLPIGAIRNMNNPGPFGDPDKMSSFNF